MQTQILHNKDSIKRRNNHSRGSSLNHEQPMIRKTTKKAVLAHDHHSDEDNPIQLNTEENEKATKFAMMFMTDEYINKMQVKYR